MLSRPSKNEFSALAFSAPGNVDSMSARNQTIGLGRLLSERLGFGEYDTLLKHIRTLPRLEISNTDIPPHHYLRVLYPAETFSSGVSENLVSDKKRLEAVILNLSRYGYSKYAIALIFSSDFKGSEDIDRHTTFPGNYGLVSPFSMPVKEQLGFWTSVAVLVTNDHPRRCGFTNQGATAKACYPIIGSSEASLAASLNDAANCVRESLFAESRRLEQQNIPSPKFLGTRDFVKSSWVVSFFLNEAARLYQQGSGSWPVKLCELTIDPVNDPHNPTALVMGKLIAYVYATPDSAFPCAESGVA